MNLSRRHFSVLAGTAMAGALVESAASARLLNRCLATGRSGHDETWFTWKSVGDNAWAGLGEGGNSLAIFDDSKWLLIDTKNAGYGDTLRREAGSLVKSATLERVINTHHHADHTGGNYAFAPGVPILAHAKAIPRVRDQVGRYKERIKGVPAQVAKSDNHSVKLVLAEAEAIAAGADKLTVERFVPTESFEKDAEVKLGARRLALRHFGPGHTDNDLVVYLPDLNLMHTGDLLFMGRHPVMDVRAGATSAGWLASLARMIEMCNDKTVVVPGHGDITDITGLRTQVRYFETVRSHVAKAIETGAGREEALRLPIDEFKEYASPERRNSVLGAVYDELKPSGK